MWQDIERSRHHDKYVAKSKANKTQFVPIAKWIEEEGVALPPSMVCTTCWPRLSKNILLLLWNKFRVISLG